MKTLTVMLIVLACAPARAETFKDANGRVIGRSTTNNAGTTFYDSMGRQTGRSTTNNAGTTFYDSSGRQTGRSTGRR